jgi:hypothetical protein
MWLSADRWATKFRRSSATESRGTRLLFKLLILLATPTGFEPVTPRLGKWQTRESLRLLETD